MKKAGLLMHHCIRNKIVKHFVFTTFTIALVLLFSVPSFADKGTNHIFKQYTVKGKVVDENGSGIPGVSILEKGTTNGTMTANDGSFALNVINERATLIVSNIGYQTQEVAVTNSELTIVMQAAQANMDEVVVTALGVLKNKRSLSYSAQTVDVKDFNKVREANIANSLAGKVSGLDIVRSSRGVSSAVRVNFRGDRSILGSNDALIIIDGVPGSLGALSPDDIATMNTLKGASATGLYGSEGANGVIVITTKKGSSSNRFNVNFNSNVQLEQVVPTRSFQNQYAQGSSGTYVSTAEMLWGPRMDTMTKAVKYWSLDPADAGKTYMLQPHPQNFKDFFDIGKTFANSIAVSGGNERLNAYFSYTNTNGKGIIDNNKMKKNNLNLRVGGNITSKLSFDVKLGYINEKLDNVSVPGENSVNIMRQIYRIPTNISLQDAKHYQFYNSNNELKQNYWTSSPNLGLNPYWVKYNMSNLTEGYTFNYLISASYQFIPSLSLMLRSGYDINNADASSFINVNTFIYADNGMATFNQSTNKKINNDFLFSYKPDLGESFKLSALFGGADKKMSSKGLYTSTNKLVHENIFTLPNGAPGSLTPMNPMSEREKQSLYAGVDMEYKNFLMLSLTGRNDWTSTLKKGEWSYFFPSIGGAIIVSELVKMPELISLFKLRASHAVTGIDPAGAYLTDEYFDISTGGAMTKPTVKIPDVLKPELTRSNEFGFELNVLKNRLGLDFSWFNAITKNQLFTVEIPPASGYAAKYQNSSSIQNKGVEVILNATPVSTKSFSWSLNTNYSKNINKVLDLGDVSSQYVLRSDYMVYTKIIEGKPYGEMFSRGFQRDNSGKILVDNTGKPLYTGDRTVYIGNSRPKWLGSLNNRFNYNNFSLNFLISARMGSRIASFTDAVLAGDGYLEKTLPGRGADGILIDGVKADGSANQNKISSQQYWASLGGRSSPIGEMFVFDASNIRLREVVLNYNLPKNVLPERFIKSASVSLSGRNLFFFMNKAKEFDPEMVAGADNGSIGIDEWNFPMTRTYGLNLNINF